MSSNQQPCRVHIAIFPSLMALNAGGAGDFTVRELKGSYSKVVGKNASYPTDSIVKRIFTAMITIADINWNVEQTKKSFTIKELAEDLKRNNIPDIMISHITIIRKYQKFSNYTQQNEMFFEPWYFEPYTFRKGMWDRLKATNFPAKKLYEKYVLEKREALKDLKASTRKRWRDSILMNKPHPNLTNDEIRSIWQGYPFVLILKESRGDFNLMDIGELKI